MTVSTTTSRADYTGNGTTTAFAVPFYFLDDSHLTVLRTQISTGVITTLAITTNYTVSGAGNPAGGTVTCVVAPTTDQKISILRNVPLTQLNTYVPNDPFPAASHERALDKLTMEVQQLDEAIDRALTLPPNTPAGTVSSALPSPVANRLIGWDNSATALQNVDAQTLATIITSGNTYSDLFSGNGVQTAFTLSNNPGSISNLDVSISGVTQRPGIDYTWVSGTTLTISPAPASGTNNILVRYGNALPQSTTIKDAQTFDTVAFANASAIDISVNHIRTAGYYANGDGGGALYKRVASGATGAGTPRITSNSGNVIWELAADTELNVRRFGARGDNTGDDSTAINGAISFLGAAGGKLSFPAGNYRITSTINASTPVLMEGVGSGSVYQPAQASATALTWAGSVGGDVVRFGGFGTLVSGGGIIGMKIDGIASAANGLRIKDSQRAYFRDVTITGATANGLLMENSASGGTFDPTGFHVFDDLRIMLRGGATNSARGIFVNGSGTGAEGVTICTFRRCRIDHANAAGVEVGNIGDYFTWESLNTFRADVETGPGVWFSATSANAVCGGHTFIHSNVSAGYRFDTPNIHYQTRIINTGHLDVNAATSTLFGRGSGDVVVDTGTGFAYGQGLLQPLHVFKRRDACALIRHDTTNSVLHTADGNWRTFVSAGGSINASGQPGSALDLTTGATAGDITAIFDTVSVGNGDGFASTIGYCSSFLVAPVANTAVVARVGWASSTGASPTNAIYVEYNPSASANWRLVCTNGGTSTTVTSTVAVQVLAKQEIYIFVEPNSAGVSAYFRAANQKLFLLIGTITTNIPTAALSTMCWIRTTAAANKRVDIYGVKVGALDEV